MKARTIKCVKGNSVVFVDFHGATEEGRITERDELTAMFRVDLRTFDDLQVAKAHYWRRIGELVDAGYIAERQDSGVPQWVKEDE